MPHLHELYDFTVAPFIVFENKVLLVEHPRYSKWLNPGGHIELNEDTDEALFREIKEETGYDKKDLEVLGSKPNLESPGTKFLITPNFMDVHEANPPHRHIALVYFLKAKHGNHIKSDEHTDMQWFSIEDINKPEYKISSSIAYYAKKAIKEAAPPVS
jgi:8-oxo-dGTP pyrophosphatase MutT (NUDIX family)